MTNDAPKVISLDSPAPEPVKPPEEPIEDPNVITIKLSQPIPGFDGNISELRIKKPTGADLIRIGNPVNFDPISDPPRISHDMPKMIKMISRLTGLSSISLDLMAPQDLINASWALSPFFLPPPGQQT